MKTFIAYAAIFPTATSNIGDLYIAGVLFLFGLCLIAFYWTVIE